MLQYSILQSHCFLVFVLLIISEAGKNQYADENFHGYFNGSSFLLNKSFNFFHQSFVVGFKTCKSNGTLFQQVCLLHRTFFCF